MHSTAGNQWVMILFLLVILSTVFYQEVSAGRGPASITRSAVESLRDRGTYIICFKSHVSKKELHRFAAALARMSTKESNFAAEIIEKLFVIKCLTARLSRRALSWVRTVYICKSTITTCTFFW